jgi:ferric-dicitrate binding protein FerR (iron transport regulator)
MGEQARLTIDRVLMNAGGEITLGSGAMTFERPAEARPAPVRIRSPYALIAVRGTRFFAGPSNGVFGVFVEKGRVQVSGGGRSVTLRAGQGTDIRAPGGRPTAPRQWGRARIEAAYTSVR